MVTFCNIVGTFILIYVYVYIFIYIYTYKHTYIWLLFSVYTWCNTILLGLLTFLQPNNILHGETETTKLMLMRLTGVIKYPIPSSSCFSKLEWIVAVANLVRAASVSYITSTAVSPRPGHMILGIKMETGMRTSLAHSVMHRKKCDSSLWDSGFCLVQGFSTQGRKVPTRRNNDIWNELLARSFSGPCNPGWVSHSSRVLCRLAVRFRQSIWRPLRRFPLRSHQIESLSAAFG